MCITVDNSWLKKLKKIFVYKNETINAKPTTYTRQSNICNPLKINKLKSVCGSYDHIHSTDYIY
jgi:hypothetical protein